MIKQGDTMKKPAITITILLTYVLLSTACAGSGAQAAGNPGGELSPTQTEAQNISSDAADAPKVLYGEIVEVIGNAFVIKEMVMPERVSITFPEDVTEFTLPDGTVVPIGEDGRPDLSDVDMSVFQTGEGRMSFTRPDGEQGALTESSGDGPRTVRPEGAESGMPFERSERPEGASGGTPQRRVQERQYTGEELEVIVPVGIPLMTVTRGENGMEEKELALTAIKGGDTITITYKTDGKTIDTVYITQGTAGGTIAGGPGGDAFFGGRVDSFGPIQAFALPAP
jgi:hypothetical protein